MPAHETTVTVHDWSPSRVAIDCVCKGTAIGNGQAVIAACQVHVPSITVLAPFDVANKSFPTMLACQKLPLPLRCRASVSCPHRRWRRGSTVTIEVNSGTRPTWWPRSSSCCGRSSCAPASRRLLTATSNSFEPQQPSFWHRLTTNRPGIVRGRPCCLERTTFQRPRQTPLVSRRDRLPRHNMCRWTLEIYIGWLRTHSMPVTQTLW